VQPYIALGRGLRAAGHDVCLASSPRTEPSVREAGLDFAPISCTDPLLVLDSPEARDAMSRDGGVVSFFRSVDAVSADGSVRRLADGWQACRGADVLVASPLACVLAYSVAEKLHIPLVRAFYFPATPTRAYSAHFVRGLTRLPGSVNLWTHRVQGRVILAIIRRAANRARAEVLGLGPLPADPFAELDRRRAPMLYGYSPLVCPPPADWGSWIHVTGYWFLDAARQWTPPAALVRFLASGPPPIYVGFGSMAPGDREPMTRLVVEALRREGLRGVLAAGWGALQDIGSTGSRIIAVDDVPHDWLFPRVAAVVHHGGAGTTAAGFRAGVPAVVVPFGVPDQTFWARRAHDLGVAVRPIARKALTADRLSAALRAATRDEGMRQRAAALGRQIRAEDGVARAVEAFERQFCAQRRRAG